MILGSPVGFLALHSLQLQDPNLSLTHAARYYNDLWVFDTQEYTWRQIEFKETEPRPSYESTI